MEIQLTPSVELPLQKTPRGPSGSILGILKWVTYLPGVGGKWWVLGGPVQFCKFASLNTPSPLVSSTQFYFCSAHLTYYWQSVKIAWLLKRCFRCNSAHTYIYVQSLCNLSEWVSGANYDARLGTGQVDRTSLWPECRKWIDKGRCSDMNDITRSRLCVDLCQRSLETSFISLMSTVPPISNIIVWYFQNSMQLAQHTYHCP